MLATLAGAPILVALRLGGSMLALQASIGALNDLVDAGIDSGRKPGKPIPRGAATPTEAAGIAVAGLVLGLGLSAASGLATTVVAAAGVACGYAYDLRLSRTPWSWLPLAVALPLVPVHAWLGSTGTAPAALLAIVPAGFLAGLGLMLANGLADEDRDRAAGVRTAVLALGRPTAWAIHAAALGAAVAIVAVAGPGLLRMADAGLTWRGAALAAAVALIVAGVALASRPPASLRERAWELEAVGVAVLAIAWLGGVGEP